MIGYALGQGGEGTVYEINNHPSKVIKLYNLPDAGKTGKLRYMVSLAGTAVQQYAAWPLDITTDSAGQATGFVMKKLAGAVPLHKLFSPIDRKRIFPDKGYNFLVHVSRNLALAFHNLHAAGVVAGDVNEGNLLVDAKGMVSFIDCDSFQLKNGREVYFCEVGVPRYTPPELLERGSFQNVLRTPGTDQFSMAVLLFQLLFLGRHPYAGRNTTREDIDEETAIRNNYFAFSLRSRVKKLLPPPNSLGLDILPGQLADFFHRSFESRSNRPEPAEWIRELDLFLKEMITCSHTKLHTYPGRMQRCPWCEFKHKTGALYFLDDSYLQSHAMLQDVESFVNGFQIEKIRLPERTVHYVNPALVAAPIDSKLYWGKHLAWIIPVLITVAAIGLALSMSTFWPVWLGVATARGIRSLLPWKEDIKNELTRMRYVHQNLVSRFESLLDEYNQPNELTAYERSAAALGAFISRFRNLPDELQKKKEKEEEKLYDGELQKFLRHFSIQTHSITQFGAGKKALLYLHGIHTAADITALRQTKIIGIGPKNMQTLFAWQREMASQFVYTPDAVALNRKTAGLLAEISGIKHQLEGGIRKEFQVLQTLKTSIENKRSLLNSRLDELGDQLYQAELDLQAFENFAG